MPCRPRSPEAAGDLEELALLVIGGPAELKAGRSVRELPAVGFDVPLPGLTERRVRRVHNPSSGISEGTELLVVIVIEPRYCQPPERTK
jgi:hypothetical protein